jgi:hypothetical protein
MHTDRRDRKRRAQSSVHRVAEAAWHVRCRSWCIGMTTHSPALHRTRADRNPSRFATFVRENGLSLVLAAMFLASVAGQIIFGLAAYNEERAHAGFTSVTLGTYLTSGHFLEAVFENWESEFLQMGIFIVLSAKLVQKGSAESKSLEEPNESDEDPRQHRQDPKAPWPVRRGGLVLVLYENSLAIAFVLLFVSAFVLHAVGGYFNVNEENLANGRPLETFGEYWTSSQFWFESFQNWQSEFLAVLAIVVLTIFLRQRGSPQSKPVAAPHDETGV